MYEEFLVLGCEASHFDGNMATFWSNLLLSVMRVKGSNRFLRHVGKFLPKIRSVASHETRVCTQHTPHHENIQVS
jgi:hypothetical protein